MRPEQPLIPNPGKLRMHSSNGAINHYVDAAQAAADVYDRNHSVEFLRETFFDFKNPTVLEVNPVFSGGFVATIIPSAPYTPDSLLVIAADTEALSNPDSCTQFIYDYPRDQQILYWGTAINYLKAFDIREKENPSPQGVTIFASENCTNLTGEHRTSRSVKIPHIQINSLDHEDIHDAEIVPIDHMVAEQRILREGRVNKYIPEIKDAFPTEALKQIDINARSAVPFGYQISFDAGFNAESVAKVLHGNHLAVNEVMGKRASKLRESLRGFIKPLPSYRLYMFLEQRGLEVIISPQIVSHAGVMEFMGIDFSRHRDNPKKYSDEEQEARHKRILQIKKFLE